jgi:hypothetical protein
VEGQPGPHRPSRLPLFFNPTEQKNLHCPICAEEQLESVGFTYQTCLHSAPFIERCPVHGVLLKSSFDRTHMYDEQCKKNKPTDLQIAIEYSKRLETCVDTPWEKSPCQKKILLEQFLTKNWLSPKGRFAITPFLDSFSNFFFEKFQDYRLDLLLSTDKYVQSAISNLRRPEKNLYPVWCILFNWFLDEADKNKVILKNPSDQKSCNLIPTKKIISSAIATNGNLTKAALALRLDVSALSALCRRHNIFFTKRTKSVFPNVVEKIEKMIGSGMTVAAVAKKCGVSVCTVYRTICASPSCRKLGNKSKSIERINKARQVWLNQLEKNQTATVTQIRHANLSDWTFLYRNDTEWLKRHSTRRIPTKRNHVRTPPHLLFQFACQAVDDAIARCDSLEDAPKMKSVYRIKEMSGLTETSLKNIPKIQEFTSLSDDTDPRKPFVLRRIAWALKLQPDFDFHPEIGWKLAKESGLRLSSLEIVSPECIASILQEQNRKFNDTNSK